MKTNNKIASMTLGLLLSAQAFAETNWNELVETVKKAEYETVKLDEGKRVEFQIAKLPKNKIRFMGFKNYANENKMKLTIHSSKTDLEKICNDYSVLKKKFTAELSFNTRPVNDYFQFTLKDGRELSSASFENSFSSYEAQVSPLGDMDKTPWTLNSGDFKKMRREGVKEGFASLLNAAIKEQGSATVVVDLSDYNGIACDLAFGYIKPVVTRTIEFEKALPDSSYWISKENYVELSKNFWGDRSLMQGTHTLAEMKASELVLLGMSLSDRKDKEAIFKKTGRALGLLNALTSNTVEEYASPADQWKKTFEYALPTGNTQMKQKMVIQSGEVFTSLEP